MTLVQECSVEPYHTHEYPSDWTFGGPAGTDPRVDSRFEPDSYIYLDGTLHVVHTASHLVCDDEAIDYFTQVAEWGLNPVYLQAKRRDRTVDLLDWQYNEETDTVFPMG